jgi:periplasmic divalent cation tolerance protein
VTVFYVTCKGHAEAEKIAVVLLRAKLAVCINIFDNVKSIYLWKGKIERADESVLIVKTKDSFEKKVFKEISKHHSYDSPEILSFRVSQTTEKISSWLEEELK